MKFRPCIDIHNGKVKQIVGGSLTDKGDHAEENFVAESDASYYAALYKKKQLKGGHIILLNPVSSPYYKQTKEQGMKALHTYFGGLQIGGGIHDKNAAEFLEAGASHVIVTSFVFKDGMLDYRNLENVVKETGREHLVLDLSCRKKEDGYYIVTDRWQKFTDMKVNKTLLKELEQYCDEFLIHGVDVEGKNSGPELELIRELGAYRGIPVTYAGGIVTIGDIKSIRQSGASHLDITIGSALDLFGGKLSFEEVLDILG